MKLQKIRFLVPLLLLGLAISGCGSKSTTSGGTNSTGTYTISATFSDFSKTGPHTTTLKTLTGYTVYCPETLTANHPVLTWGNGKDVPTRYYATLLIHLASYGFVIVCTDSKQNLDGKEMIAGIDLMQQQNSTSGSFFYQKLNMNTVVPLTPQPIPGSSAPRR